MAIETRGVRSALERKEKNNKVEVWVEEEEEVWVEVWVEEEGV